MQSLFRVIAVCAVVFPLSVVGADWPQFRGLNRDGWSGETGLLDAWPEEGPAEIWRIAVGEGYSAPSVIGDDLYVMFAGDSDGEQVEFAVKMVASTGEEVWRTAIGNKIETEFGNGPRATPTVDGDLMFVLGGEGDFAALRTQTGEKVWGYKLTDQFGGNRPGWGFASSALVDGSTVVIQAGGPEGKSYVGLDRATGDLKWSTDDSRAGYNSALPVVIDGQKQYVCIVSNRIMALDPSGGELWSHPWPQGETHAMPVFVPPSTVYASGAEGVGATVLDLDLTSKPPTITERWKTPFMRNHFSSAIHHDGYVYGFDNATFKCLALEDGELAWAKRGLGKGSLIAADDKLIVLSDRGKLLLVHAKADGFQSSGSVQALRGRCWTAPVLADGHVYVRSHQEMVCYKVTP